MQILGNGIVVFCNKNLCTSEEKRNKNTPLIVELSFSDGLKKKKKMPRPNVIKSILTNALTGKFSKKKNNNNLMKQNSRFIIIAHKW